jgi:hypothetical protein
LELAVKVNLPTRDGFVIALHAFGRVGSCFSSSARAVFFVRDDREAIAKNVHFTRLAAVRGGPL